MNTIVCRKFANVFCQISETQRLSSNTCEYRCKNMVKIWLNQKRIENSSCQLLRRIDRVNNRHQTVTRAWLGCIRKQLLCNKEAITLNEFSNLVTEKRRRAIVDKSLNVVAILSKPIGDSAFCLQLINESQFEKTLSADNFALMF